MGNANSVRRYGTTRYEPLELAGAEGEDESSRVRRRRRWPPPAAWTLAARAAGPLAADDTAASAAAPPDDAAVSPEELTWHAADNELDDESSSSSSSSSRDSRAYIMWVQRSLNTLAGLRLAVDGISGPITRSAVRDFQARWHLSVDGIVGPQTEAALLRAGAVSPPGSSAPGGSRPGAGQPAGGNGRVFQTSSDGTPLFRQGDPQWGSQILGIDSIGAEGCAITSMAMAISKIARRIITPGDVDHWIDDHGGYGGGGDSIRDWNAIAQIAGLGAQRLDGLDFGTINAQVDRGRPVVIGVDKTGDGSTDHWIALTRRATEAGRTVYYANDPATGAVIKLAVQGRALVGTSNSYRSTGAHTVITGG